MVPMGHPPAQPAVSSSSTLWAQASKEWVIPAKPKPGRKPKKEAPPPVREAEETDSKGRRVQNRAAQRAFRERKQSQLADLQARVQSYEQGEIERNVALQNIAKRLKEENETLRRENQALKDEVARLKNDRDTVYLTDRKRWRDDGISIHPTYPLEHDPRKRLRTGTESPVPPSQLSHSITYMPSPPSMASSPDSNAGSSFSPLPVAPPSRAQSAFSNQIPTNNGMAAFPRLLKPSEHGASFDAFDCGLCNENTPCVCREITLQHVSNGLSNHDGPPLKLEAIEQNTAVISHPTPESSPPNSVSVSILDNLPAYQPAVPLRRNGGSGSSVSPIFQIRLASPRPSSKNLAAGAVCSGDPSNCMACADDVFGKAFCTALGDSACSSSSCATCPNRPNAGADSSSAPSPHDADADAITLTPVHAAPSTQAADRQPSETIPCSEAWRQLKSHPNIAFADLSMLAEVVARRTKCNGPLVVVSPAPGSVTPERSLASALPGPSQSRTDDNLPILLMDPHARYHQQQRARPGPSSPPTLVPQDVLVQCGRTRLREVDAGGVAEALRILDVQFGRP